MWKAKIIADSISPDDVRLTTLELKYPRFIHAEFLTHRLFSRNSSSNRAIPTKRALDEVVHNPVIPIYWGKNKPGMQADEEQTNMVRTHPHGDLTDRKTAWLRASREAADNAEYFSNAEYHKQISNRIIEPFQWISTVVTATEWDNFFELRLDEAAQPEIYKLADMMWNAIQDSEPILLKPGDWHSPYCGGIAGGTGYERWLKCSAARCARVSYNNHNGEIPDVKEDVKLADQLLSSRHLSPFEHQATPMTNEGASVNDSHPDTWEPGVTHIDQNFDLWSGNLKGWIQYRQLI